MNLLLTERSGFSSLSSLITIVLWGWILVSSLALVIISRYTNGVQEIEMLLENGNVSKWQSFSPLGPQRAVAPSPLLSRDKEKSSFD